MLYQILIVIKFRFFHPLIVDLGLERYSNCSCRSCALETGLSVFCKSDDSTCLTIYSTPVLAFYEIGYPDSTFFDFFIYIPAVDPSERIRVSHNGFTQASLRYYDIYGPGYFFIYSVNISDRLRYLSYAARRAYLSLAAAGLVTICSNTVIYRCQPLEIFRLYFCRIRNFIFVSLSCVARRNDICPGRIRLGCHIGPLNIVGANSASTCILYCYNDPIA